ncbi:MAG: RNA-binding domain-containing protein, partial [Ignavibacteria bacterium]
MNIDPHNILIKPEDFIDFMKSMNAEGQYFDRKEIRTEGKGMLEAREKIKTCVSAFTNSRGGILVLGISDSGDIVGLNHLNENEYNSLTQTLRENVSNHQSETFEWFYETKKLLFIYSPVGFSGVSKTIESHPKGWYRDGANSLPLTSEIEQRLIIERSKKFEQLAIIEFNENLINEKVFDIFKKRYLQEQGSTLEWNNDIEFLDSLGAIKLENAKYFFTNAGYLFFSKNPAALIPSATVRFLRYPVESSTYPETGTPDFERTFDGNLSELLQKIRAFVNEGAFFKKYIYRNTYQSGIVEENELPLNAIEEAIVNAIIHRDYLMPVPIDCILYKDAFVVKSPGKLNQPSYIPTSFSLDTQVLSSYPRNPKIVQWAKTMVDENGQRFVKALSEGNRRMRDDMKAALLPPPAYKTNGFTTVILYNNYKEREARIRKISQPLSGEYTNLFEVNLATNELREPEEPNKSTQSILLGLIRDKLLAVGWFIDRNKKSRIVAHQRGKNISQNETVDTIVKFFPSYSFQVHYIKEQYYLSIDFDLQVKNALSLDSLVKYNFLNFTDKKTLAKFEVNIWANGLIKSIDEVYADVYFFDYDITKKILLKDVLPALSKSEIKKILLTVDKRFNIDLKIKELSLSNSANASKERWDKIELISQYISRDIFPLRYNGFTANVDSKPVSLINNFQDDNEIFSVHHNLKEPEVKFADNATAPNIASGLTRFGSFSNERKEIEIIPFCLTGFEDKMETLLHVISQGSNQFKGIEKTFKVKTRYQSIITKQDANQFLEESKRLLHENPSWVGNNYLNKIFLVHTPEDIYPITDIDSPYYTIKEFLLQSGMPVQMLDTPTLNDARYKDLNLALNIVAKTGGTPWILPNKLTDVDCFIGLSYAQYIDNKKMHRTMGYANVFSNYGEWQYYKGNTESFDFDRKYIYLAKLVLESIRQISNLPESAKIHIHYTSKFSKDDVQYISNEIFKFKPNAIITFIWINTSHNLRMFDTRIEGNGSLSRGAYVVTRNNQFYLSTTGYSTLRKTLGTPVMLEVNMRTMPLGASYPSHKTVAQHLLALS